MKTLKFASNLVSLILSGEKTVTWRLFDDKELKEGDTLEFINKETGEKFAQAEILSVREKRLDDIEESDYEGHEKFNTAEEMLETYRGYYGDRVIGDTIVKIIRFKIVD